MPNRLSAAELRSLRELRTARGRHEAERFVVEGEKAVRELLAQGVTFEAVYATSAWPGDASVRISPAEMRRISHFPNPSPVLAVGRIRHERLAPGALAQGLTLALDTVQDPGNLGTILRIADWFAFDRVVLSPGCADPHSPKAIQASMGSFARVPVAFADLAEALARPGAPVLGCDAAGEPMTGAPPPGRNAVVVIGSEGRGLSPAVRPLLTRTVAIPRYGRAESLNAAVAAGIVCAWLRRGSAAT